MANNLGGYWKLAAVLKNLTKHEQKSRGTATVRDVDDEGIVWVTPSGTDEAVPAAGVNVASVSVGDVVTVENNGGRLSIVGNATEPAVGQLTVNTTVNQVVETARESIARVIDVVSDVASEARKVAEATGQHFFADDSGIHVTEAEGDPDTDHNILINSLGMLLRLATDPLVSITASATEFYDGLGDLAGNVVAKFGRAGATIGKVAGEHVTITSTAMELLNGATSHFKVWLESNVVKFRIGPANSYHLLYDSASNGIQLRNGTTVLAQFGAAQTLLHKGLFSIASDSGGGNAGTSLTTSGTLWLNATTVSVGTLSLNTDLTVANGGTGASTAAAARANLGAAARSWTSLGSTTGTTALTIDLSSYYEVCVVARYSTSYLGSIVLPKAALHASTEREIYLGGWGNSSTSSNRRAVAHMTQAKLTPVAVTTDGTERASSATWTVYAR